LPDALPSRLRFRFAAELMPAQHRRTYGAIYEIMLAGSFTLLPLAGFMLADNPNGFRLIALPATLGLFVAPVRRLARKRGTKYRPRSSAIGLGETAP
jgi:hypothetical protein